MENGLARTPPMGWNSWNQVRCHGLTQDVVRAAAEAMADNGMREAGYSYIVVDDCYQGGREPGTGRLFSHPGRFPDGMRALGDHIHELGLKFGIYGVPGTRTCANDWDDYPVTGLGSHGHERVDAETWADWGVDYLKYDWCDAHVNAGAVRIPAFTRMRDELARTGRDIVYSISEYGVDSPWLWAGDVANSWRTTQDIDATWASVSWIIDCQADLWAHARPGAWNDPDMLQVGNGEFARDIDANRAHMGMWAMLAAPLMVGTSIPDLDPRLVSILTNPEMIAIDQDPLGRQARRVVHDDQTQVWARDLTGGRIAVALYNPTGSAREIGVGLAQVGAVGSLHVRSVWDRADLGPASAELVSQVPPRGVGLFVLVPRA